MKRESVGVFKGSPKSWQPLGEVDQKPVEPVFTRGFSVHWATQPETRPNPKSVEPGSNPVEPVFKKSLHTTFLIAFDCQTGRTEVAEETVQKSVEPVSCPVEPVFETEEQVLIKLKWNKVELLWGVRVVFQRTFMILKSLLLEDLKEFELSSLHNLLNLLQIPLNWNTISITQEL